MPYDYPHYSSATLGRRSASSSAHWSPSVISSRSYGSSSYSGLDSSTTYSPSPLSSVSLYLPPRTPLVPSSPAPSHRTLRPSTSQYVTSRPVAMSSAMAKRETIIRNLVRSSHDLESHHFLSNDSVSMITNSNYYQSSSRRTPPSQPVSRPNKYSRSYTTDLSTSSALAGSSSLYRTSSPVYTIPERVYRDPYRPIIIERPSLANYVPPPKEERSKALPRAIRRDRPLIKFLEREDVNPVKVRHLLDAWSKGEVLEEERPHEEEETESQKRDSVRSNDSGIGSYRSSFLRRSRQKSGDTTNDSNQTISDSNKHDIEDNETRANLIPKAHTPSVDEGVHLDADDGFRTPTPIISPLGFQDDSLDLCDENKLQNNISTGTNDDIISDNSAAETCRVKRRVRICADKYVDSSADKDKTADENNNTEYSQNLNDRRSSTGKRVRTSIVDSKISINQNNTEIKPDTADISNNCDLKNVLNVNNAQNERTSVTSDKRETCIEKNVSSDTLRAEKGTSLTSELKPQTSEGILIKDTDKIQTDLKICNSDKSDKQKSGNTQPEKPLEKCQELNTQTTTLEAKENLSTSTEVKKKKKVKKLDGEIKKTTVKKIESNESDVGVPASESNLSQVTNLSSEANKNLPVCNQKDGATRTGVIPLKSKDKPTIESSASNEKVEYKSVKSEKPCIPTSESDKVTQSGKIEKDALVKLKKDPPSSYKDNSFLGSDKSTSASQSPSMHLASSQKACTKDLQTKGELTCQKSSVSAEKKIDELGVKTINRKITTNKVETIIENKLDLADKKITALSKETEKVKQISDDVLKFTPKLKAATTFGDKTKLLREHEKLPPKPVVAKTKDESLNQDEISQKSVLKKKPDKIIEDTKTDSNILKDSTLAESTFSSGKSKITLNKEAKPENLHTQDLKQANNTVQSLTKNEKKITFKENIDKESKNAPSATIKEIDISLSTELKLKKERKDPTTPTQTNMSEKATSVTHIKDMVSDCKIEANDVREEKLCNEKSQKMELKDNTKLLAPETKTRTWKFPKEPKLEESKPQTQITIKPKKFTTAEKTKDKTEESQINVDFVPSSTTETSKVEQIKDNLTLQENPELPSQPLKTKTGKEKITERKEITKQITTDNSSPLINKNVLKSENIEAKPILETSNQLLKAKEHLSKINEKNEKPKKAKEENISPITSSNVSKIENSETQLISSENISLSSQLLTNKSDDKKVAKKNAIDNFSTTLNTNISKSKNSETKIIPSESTLLSSQLLTNKSDDKKVTKKDTVDNFSTTPNTNISKSKHSETKIIPSESTPLSSQLLTNKSDDKKMAKKDAVDNSSTALNTNIFKSKNYEAKLASSECLPVSIQLLKNQKDDKKVAKNMENTSSSTLSTNISKLENPNDATNVQLSTDQLKDKRDPNIPEVEPSSNALITEISKTEIQKKTLPSDEKCMPTIAESKDVKQRIDDKTISSGKKEVIYKPKRRISDALLATSEKFMVKSKVTSIPEKVQSKNLLNSELQKLKIMESKADPIIIPKTIMANQVIKDKIDLIKEDKSIDLVKEDKSIDLVKEDKSINLIKEDKSIDLIKEDKSIDLIKEDKNIDLIKEDKSIDLIKEDKSIDLIKEDKSIDLIKEDKSIDLIKEDKNIDLIKEDKSIDLIKEDKSIDLIKEDKSIDLIKEDKSIDLIKEDKIIDLITADKIIDLIKEDKSIDLIKEDKSIDLIKEDKSIDSIKENKSIDLIKEDKIINLIKEDKIIDLIKEDKSIDLIKEDKSIDLIKENKSIDLIKEDKSIDLIKEDKSIDLIKEDKSIDLIKEDKIIDLIKEDKSIDSIKENKSIDLIKKDKIIDLIKENKSIDELGSIDDKEKVPHCSSPKTQQTEKSKLIKLQKSSSADVSPLGQNQQKNLDGDIKKIRRSSLLDRRELPATQPNFEAIKQILGSNRLKHVAGDVDNSHKAEKMTSKVGSGLKTISSSQKTIKRSTTEDLSTPRESLIPLQKSLSTDGNDLANKTAIHDLSPIVKPPLPFDIKTALPKTNESKSDTQSKETRKVCKIQRSTTAEIISNSSEKINILQKSPSAGSNNIQKVLDTQLPVIPPRLHKPPLPTPFPRKQKVQTSSDKSTTLKESKALRTHDVAVSAILNDSKNDAQLQGKVNDIGNSSSLERKSSNREKEMQSKTTEKESILKTGSSIEPIVKTVDTFSQKLQEIGSSQTLQETSSSHKFQENRPLQKLQEICSEKILIQSSTIKSAKVVTTGKENKISEKTEITINKTEESSADSKLIEKSCSAVTAKELQEIKSNDALSVIPTDTQIVKQSDNIDNQTLQNTEILPLENLPLTENKLNIDGKIAKVKTKKDKKAKTEDGEKPKKKKKKKIPVIPVSTDDTQTESLTVINERTEDTCPSATPIPVRSQSKEKQHKCQKEDADINNITVPDKEKPIDTNEKDEKAHAHELELLFNDYRKNHAEDSSKTATSEKTASAIENSAIPKRYRIEDFNLLKVLGRGSYGKVMLAELKGRNQYFAMKCLKKNVVLHDNDVECTMIEKEVLAMGSNHPYLCTLYFTFQSQCHLFFVMEYLSGGDLMFHIQQSGKFDETRARFYAAEIVCALRYLHKHGIIYRDAKLDNICIDADGHIRLVDFGFCKLRIYRKECLPRNLCGTPDYMAPEIIKGYHYNQSVDWWSFGVLLYEMLVGQSPFNGEDEEQLFWSVCHEDVHFPFFVTKEAVGMISLLLDKNPETRLGMPGCVFGDIMRHPFFQTIDWKKIEKRELEPPFKPNVVSETDVSNFDRDFTMENAALSPTDNEVLDNLDQTQFKGFTFTNPTIFEWNKL